MVFAEIGSHVFTVEIHVYLYHLLDSLYENVVFPTRFNDVLEFYTFDLDPIFFPRCIVVIAILILLSVMNVTRFPKTESVQGM